MSRSQRLVDLSLSASAWRRASGIPEVHWLGRLGFPKFTVHCFGHTSLVEVAANPGGPRL